MARILSRGRESNNDIVICPYCSARYSNETKEDYYIFENTKINYCRECGLEFCNGITKTK